MLFKVYKAFLHSPAASTSGAGETVLVKHRFHKQYRHPALDVSLTRARVAGEARALMKCLRSAVRVPAIRMVDALEGVIAIEWIDGQSVRHLLPGGADEEESEEEAATIAAAEIEADAEIDPLLAYGLTQAIAEALMELVGTELAKMHMADVIHGDLTTSNMMLQLPSAAPTAKAEVVLIDFGLAYTSGLVEDKAVDLYVLERAFASTHPDAEPLFASVMRAYARKIGKEWKAVERRLDDGGCTLLSLESIPLCSTLLLWAVRLRGRKRSMVG
ncbi:hypothetical protein HWV62_20461 [Athelia sp. TMB]|nr:hypothetical protein HWV62_20461 [Athelia sp. TMB]